MDDLPVPRKHPPAPPLQLQVAETTEPAAPAEEGATPPASRAIYATSRQPLALAYTWLPTVREFLAGLPQGCPLLLRLAEVRLTSDVQRALADYPDALHLLAIAPEGLPDSPGVLPFWIRLAEACPHAELRFACDADLIQVDRLLGDDHSVALESLELPQLLIFDEEWRPLGHWGPRPHAAEPLLDEWLAHNPSYELLSEAAAQPHGEPQAPAAQRAAGNLSVQQAFAALNQTLMLQMRIWYNSGLDVETSNELQALLLGLREEAEGALPA